MDSSDAQDEVEPSIDIPYYKPKSNPSSQKHKNKNSFIITHLASVLAIGLIWFALIATILWFVCCRKKRKVSKAIKRAKKPINSNVKIDEKLEESKNDENENEQQEDDPEQRNGK